MPSGRRPGPPQPAPVLNELLTTGIPEHLAGLAVAIGSLRVEANLTQQQLADRSGLHHSVVTGIERGTRDPTFTTLVRLRAAFNCEHWQTLLGC
jgi:DNA-binding XRE family transcriptional regulator